jgi:hypothetical protein
VITIALRLLQIGSAFQAARGIPPGEPRDSVRRQALDTQLLSAARQLRGIIRRDAIATRRCSRDPSDDELLGQGEQVTDFFIHHLVDNYRWYTRYQLPEYATIRIKKEASVSIRTTPRRPQRRSGHITGSFAEAMAPWALQQIQVLTGEVFRLSSLSPGVFGRVLPDLALTTASGIVPCEVKHYITLAQVTAIALQAAIMQVLAGMITFPATKGYLVAAIALEDGVSPYRIEVVELET